METRPNLAKLTPAERVDLTVARLDRRCQTAFEALRSSCQTAPPTASHRLRSTTTSSRRHSTPPIEPQLSWAFTDPVGSRLDDVGPNASTITGPRPSVSVPTKIAGRYCLERRLGAGGMSTVFLGMDSVLERRVAVKLLAEHLAEDETFVARFRREALAAARLQHPNVVQVYDWGQDSESGRHYIVMEYVDGPSCADLLRDHGSLWVEDAVAYLTQACRGLDYAHRAGVIHRDVKPGNLLVARDSGILTLADFGIAKAAEEVSVTQVGSVLGTAAYLSPEQARGEETGPASDIYSLGVCGYQFLTGRLPFEYSSLTKLALKQQEAEVELIVDLRPEVPRELDLALRACLARDPTARYSTGLEAADALEAGLRGEVTEATRVLLRGGTSARGATRRPMPVYRVHTNLIRAAGDSVCQLVDVVREDLREAIDLAQSGPRGSGRAVRTVVPAAVALLLLSPLLALVVVLLLAAWSAAEVVVGHLWSPVGLLGGLAVAGWIGWRRRQAVREAVDTAVISTMTLSDRVKLNGLVKRVREVVARKRSRPLLRRIATLCLLAGTAMALGHMASLLPDFGDLGESRLWGTLSSSMRHFEMSAPAREAWRSLRGVMGTPGPSVAAALLSAPLVGILTRGPRIRASLIAYVMLLAAA